MKPLPTGIFPALIVSLIHSEGMPNFRLSSPRYNPRFRNLITLETTSGNILLVDGVCWMAVYYSGQMGCCAIREVIHVSILKIMSNFHYMANLESPNDYFYCTMCSDNTYEHFCRVNEDETLTCCEHSTTKSINESRQLPWLYIKGKF